MKFIFKGGPYRHFMGRLFAFGLPTNVTDKATIAALENQPGFVKVKEESVELVEKTPIPDVCPKCGKTVKRGKVMHQKHCKGPK
jgi:hypothetical protein